jgi:glutamyl-tRNA reductase
VPVAIVGSGSLAQGVARYLGKRSRLPVRVASRCPENAMRLAMEVGGFASGLDELAPLLRDARAIVTATAAPHALIFDHHVPPADFRRLIIDLGEPADCADEVKLRADIDYVGLLDMESVAQTNTDERRRRAAHAAAIIDEAVAVHPPR